MNSETETTVATTQDGTHTRFSQEFGEHYHSCKDGAWRESLHKHVLPGVQLSNALAKPVIRILDICFGLGFNSLATLWYLQQRNYQGIIQIISPEADTQLLASLPDHPYPTELSPYQPLIVSLAREHYSHSTEHNVTIEINTEDARQVILGQNDPFDIIYQDPFSPARNPELWSLEYFQQLLRLLSPQGIITTYSQATPVRLAMSLAGLQVYSYHNPEASIRGGTLASRCVNLPQIAPIDMVEKSRRSSIKHPYRDLHLKSTREEIRKRYHEENTT
ncbi:MnmC family methyltransferase [Desulfurispira natronophila]|uniref:tRNA U34 5-methylaminomethyl-2-thiouridine-forming methyltransferase MnmC n=1 Tax=Desulfurispira natronophila TaxID=682562 RepID=A0A7W8DFX8_9BACT|nr:tRNA U34 5-methylaminomethyl-2-thiouridine-forming methyltransferase MnmC [Desulfurispira natronophila]